MITEEKINFAESEVPSNIARIWDVKLNKRKLIAKIRMRTSPRNIRDALELSLCVELISSRQPNLVEL